MKKIMKTQVICILVMTALAIQPMQVMAVQTGNGIVPKKYVGQDLYYGDLNGDGKVTATDLSTLNQAVNGRVTLTVDEKIRADLNGDGNITKADVGLLEQFVSGEITEFPVESQLASIIIAVQPTKTSYIVGESLNTAGMVVTAKYNNGTSRNTTGYKVTGNTSMLGRQQVQVSYTEAGITKSTSFYIQVVQKQAEKKTLNYDANGGGNAPDMQTVDVDSIIQVSTILPEKYYIVSLDVNGGSGISSNTIQVKARFVGWNTNRTGTGISYLPGASLRLGTDMMLYACYESVAIGSIPSPVKKGYTFLGWYYGSSKVSANTKIGSDCRLTAKWEKDIHIHTPGAWITVSEATATAYGKQVKVCIECGVVVQEQIIPRLEGVQDVGLDQDEQNGQHNGQQGGKQDGQQTGNLVTIVPDTGENGIQKPDIDIGIKDEELEEIKEPDDTWTGDTGEVQGGIIQDIFPSGPGDQDAGIDGAEDFGTDTDPIDGPSLDIDQTEDFGSDIDRTEAPDLDTGLVDDAISGEQIDNDPFYGQDAGGQPGDIGYYNVAWNVSSAKLQKGKSTTAVKAYVTGKDEILQYLSSDESIAEVTDWGEIRGKKVGTVYITAMTEKGCAASVRIKVQKKAVLTKKLTVKKKISMRVGQTFYLKAKVSPITSSQRIKYCCTNARVASVDRTGRIKAKKKGKAIIKVTSGKKVVKVRVIVK